MEEKERNISFVLRLLKVLFFIVVSVFFILAAAYKLGYPLLYLNVTDSAPLGLYVSDFTGGLCRNDYVIMKLPREYGRLKKGALLLKQVKAVPGDIYVRYFGRLEMNGEIYGVIEDKRLPQIPYGAYKVPEGHVLLLNEKLNSFDGRYIGPVEDKCVVRKVSLLFNREIFWEKERAVKEKLSVLFPVLNEYGDIKIRRGDDGKRNIW